MRQRNRGCNFRALTTDATDSGSRGCIIAGPGWVSAGRDDPNRITINNAPGASTSTTELNAYKTKLLVRTICLQCGGFCSTVSLFL